MSTQDDLEAQSTSATILIVDDEQVLCQTITLHLRRRALKVFSAHTLEVARQLITQEKIDVILCDWRLGEESGLTLIQEVATFTSSAHLPQPPSILFMSAHASHDIALKSIELGADDFIAKPFETPELLFRLRRILERRGIERKLSELQYATSADRQDRIGGLIGRTPVMREVFELIKRVAPSQSKILLLGESGTGKEVAARVIHSLSQTPKGPFIAVNCAAIPESLVESELFGHVKGAFTHAHTDRSGLIEAAHKGTLFLDEIGELPLAVQAKLLRLLQEGEIRRVGDSQLKKVEVRVIAATLKDLSLEVKERRFREDLFYRISVIPITLPPLRERCDDIPLLTTHLIEKHHRKSNRKGDELRTPKLAASTLAQLMSYHWPGNVRELENAIEYALTLSDNETILLEDLPPSVKTASLEKKYLWPQEDLELSSQADHLGLSIKKHTQVLERRLIIEALKESDGVKTQAAKSLEISTKTLLYKLRQYKIVSKS